MGIKIGEIFILFKIIKRLGLRLLFLFRSEYGDCYMLKLFRDYVFHQVNIFFSPFEWVEKNVKLLPQVMDDNRPWLDMAHVVSNLNKLDAGVAEKITLMSRDEQNVLVVSYAELKKCLEQVRFFY